MQSFISAGYISKIVERSGNFTDEWRLLLLNNEWSPSSIDVVLVDHVPHQAIVGVINVPVRWDDRYSRLLSAVPSVTVPNIGNMAPTVTAVALFSPMNGGILAAYYGADLVSRGLSAQNTDGDLVVEFNETCPALLEI